MRRGGTSVIGVVLVAVAVALVGAPRPAAGRTGDLASVLLIYPETPNMPGISAVDTAIRTTLETRSPRPIRIYSEYLDLQPAGEHSEREQVDLLRVKYRAREPRVVIPCGPSAIAFTLAHRAELFPGVPVVFCSGDRALVPQLQRDVTGVLRTLDWAGTLDLALQLQPTTRRVAIVGGAGPTDLAWTAEARDAFAGEGRRVEFLYLTETSMLTLLREVAILGDGTVVVFGSFAADTAGRSFVNQEAVRLVAGAAHVPVYALSETLLGTGIVGGRVISFQAQGRHAAELTLRVLAGERLGPSDIIEPATVNVVDWRALQRWRISDRRVPPGTRVHFRPPSAWRLYRWQIVVGVLFVIGQSALIAALLAQRAGLRRIQQTLDDRLAFETLASDLLVGFAEVPASEVDRQIEWALRRIVDVLRVDRASVMVVDTSGESVVLTHSATVEDVAPLPSRLPLARLPWLIGRLRRGEVVCFSKLGELPAEAAADRETYAGLHTRSLVAVPLMSEGGKFSGVLSFSTTHDEREWAGAIIQRVTLLREIVANALMRRSAEQAVRESEERFRLVADSAPFPVWMTRPDGACTYVNRAWLEFTGRTFEQELGNGWTESIDPDDRQACLEDFRRMAEQRQPCTLEYRVRRADGQMRWIIDHGTPTFTEDDTFVGYVGSAFDVTERREAHEAMMESIALRGAIFTSLYGNVAAIDANGVIIAVNEAWTRFAEDNGGDPIALSVGADYLAVCRHGAAAGAVQADRAVDAIEAVLSGRVTRASFEYPCHAPGEERWFMMSVEPFRRAEGGAVVSHVDITRQRRAEQALAQHREQLAHALRLTTIGELTASLSHEINQPLAAIATNAEVALRLLDGRVPPDDELRAVLADIASDSTRAARVIRHLRALFRKKATERQLLDVNQVVANVLGLVCDDIERKSIALRLALARELPAVRADVIQLQQVLLNLVVNACEAMADTAPGAAELRIETSLRDDEAVSIAIADTGRGVAEADLERIFEPFVTGKPDGLGLGLSITRSIVEAHGGRIRATRNAGPGLAVQVELPIGEEALLP